MDNNKYVQSQAFTLAGSGSVLGSTTVTLNSMLQIDGETEITMTDFGNKGFATIEPGNGTQEEQIVFTGITQNANGTATLTGVSSVLFVSPYTETSGLSTSHPGGVTLVISNTSGFYNRLVAKDDDETITGVFTFNSSTGRPKLSSDVDTAVAAELVDFGQLSRQAIAGAANASTTVKGLVQLPTQAQVDARTTAGSTGALLSVTPDVVRSTLLSDYVIDTGTANAYAIAPTPAISAYVTGQTFTFKAIHTNTTTSTLAVSGLAAKTIKRGDGATNLGAGDIVNGQLIEVEYDGTNFQLMSPPATGLPAISSSNINEFPTTTDGSTVVWGRPFDLQSFTTSGTWTKPTNLSGNELVRVQMWGNGGGGGGVTNNNSSAGGGGGGGAFLDVTFKASELGSTVTVTIPAAAAGGVGNNDGAAGGDVTFGSLLTAKGGGAGLKGSGGNGNGGAGGIITGFIGVVGGTGGNGGGAPTPSVSLAGGGGGGGAAGSGTGSAAGTTTYGGAGGAGNSGANADGNPATGNTGGGGGGAGSNGNTKNGGAGVTGQVRVWTIY